jgi:hypothetical protein
MVFLKNNYLYLITNFNRHILNSISNFAAVCEEKVKLYNKICKLKNILYLNTNECSFLNTIFFPLTQTLKNQQYYHIILTKL